MINHDLIMANSVDYSERFGIDLQNDPFQWFLLAVLFGARISESIALKTYTLFRSYGITTPEAIGSAGFDRLVSILDAGGYARYDFRTAVKLHNMAGNIMEAGGLNAIHAASSGPADLVERLKALSNGIGDVTAGIFLREMVGVWEKASPYPSPLVRSAAERLGIDPVEACRTYGVSYARMESFLSKVGRECIRSGKKNGFCEVVLNEMG